MKYGRQGVGVNLLLWLAVTANHQPTRVVNLLSPKKARLSHKKARPSHKKVRPIHKKSQTYTQKKPELAETAWQKNIHCNCQILWCISQCLGEENSKAKNLPTNNDAG